MKENLIFRQDKYNIMPSIVKCLIMNRDTLFEKVFAQEILNIVPDAENKESRHWTGFRRR